MGWLWVWLQDRQERRAEAAARRQMIALGIDSFDVEPVRVFAEHPVNAGLPPPDLDDGPDYVPHCGGIARLLTECERADALAGKRGGFVTTTRIRELLRGQP